jgi:sugar phosphate isomerase/epimerase
MDLSIATSLDYDLPLVDMLPLARRAGFRHASLGARPEHSGYLEPEGRKRLSGLLRDLGLTLDSIHARPLHRPDAVGETRESIEAAASLGVSTLVAHAGPFSVPAAELDARKTSLRRVTETLAPAARDAGVRIALENVLPGPATDLVRDVLPDLDPEVFGLCWDSAHDQIDGPRPLGLVRELGDRLIAVHLSDRIGPHVDHVVPGEGFVDWVAVAEAIAATAFEGPLLLEVMTTHSRHRTAESLAPAAFAAGRDLRDRIRALRD